MSVAELKAQGNASFAAKDYPNAIQHYTNALAAAEQSGENDQNHVLFSNRSASHAGLKQWNEALNDAEATIKANPSFAKGYGRKGSALHGAQRYDEAIEAYKTGLGVAPEDASLKKGLADVERARDMGAHDPAQSIGNIFSDPQMMQKVAANPSTAPMLADPAFAAKLAEIQRNPSAAGAALSDPRMIQVMGVLMGLDLKAFERGAEPNAQEPEPAPKPKPEPAKPKEGPAPAPAAPEDPAKAEAEAEKKLGNEHYLKRDFATAAAHYNKAWELHKDITYLNNLGAVYYEEGRLEDCIKVCETAIEEGRAMRADYKLVAKALGRIGTAYHKMDDLEKAVTFFEKSLTEHRTPDILNKLRSTEREIKERARAAYIDPAKAEEERNRGNELYKAGDFPASVQAYTEAVKRNPSDPRGYTNRASAYTKLAALPEALKDSEEAIKVDPEFVKAYIRKSNILFAMREYTRSLEAIQQAGEVDERHGNANQREIQAQTSKCMNALYEQRANETDEQTLERAMRDPEVASIMQDPVMQSILNQAQSNPAALQDHLKNAGIRAKIQKLIAAGIIRTR